MTVSFGDVSKPSPRYLDVGGGRLRGTVGAAETPAGAPSSSGRRDGVRESARAPALSAVRAQGSSWGPAEATGPASGGSKRGTRDEGRASSRGRSLPLGVSTSTAREGAAYFGAVLAPSAAVAGRAA